MSKPRTARSRHDPYGTNERTRALTAEFGPKPNFLTWKAYHSLAKHDPDKLRDLIARYSRRPAVLDHRPSQL